MAKDDGSVLRNCPFFDRPSRTEHIDKLVRLMRDSVPDQEANDLNRIDGYLDGESDTPARAAARSRSPNQV